MVSMEFSRKVISLGCGGTIEKTLARMSGWNLVNNQTEASRAILETLNIL